MRAHRSYLATLLLSLVSSSHGDVLQLTEDNFQGITEGKNIFLKLFAPWCGHCKAMAPAFEQLSDEWKDHEWGVVAEVDCTDENAESICEFYDVEGFPTLLYGDPSAAEVYDGERTFEAMNEFAKKHIATPQCAVDNTEHCSEEEKKAIVIIKAKSVDQLLEEVTAVEEKIETAEQELEEYLDQLNEQYETRMTEFDQRVDTIKAENHYRLIQAVLRKVVADEREGEDASESDGSTDEL